MLDVWYKMVVRSDSVRKHVRLSSWSNGGYWGGGILGPWGLKDTFVIKWVMRDDGMLKFGSERNGGRVFL